MRKTSTLMVLVMAVTLTACGGPKIQTDYAPQADFTMYRTYAWHPLGNNLPDNPRYNSSLIDDRIVDAVEFALNSKGYSQASVDDADLIVVYHALVDQKTSVNTVNSYYGYDPYWGGYGAWGGWGGSSTYVRQYDEGTVVVDLIENVAGPEDRIVWRGMITDTVGDASNPGTRNQEMRDSAMKLFADYPPGSGR